MKYCPDCGARVDDSEQTQHEYDNSICPCCGGGSVVDKPEDPPDQVPDIITTMSISRWRDTLRWIAYLKSLFHKSAY